MSDPNKLYGVPEGYDYEVSFSDEAWQKVTVTWVIAKCKKTGKQLVRRMLPTVSDWEDPLSNKGRITNNK